MKNLVRNLKVRRSNRVELSYEALRYQKEIKNEYEAIKAAQHFNGYII